jgi:hypothetical protein
MFKAKEGSYHSGSVKMNASQGSQGSFFQRNGAACVDKEAVEVSKFGGLVDLFLLGKR